MFVCCECFVLTGRSLREELITRPEESYRLWCVVVCDLETSWMRRLWPALGSRATGGEKTNNYVPDIKKIFVGYIEKQLFCGYNLRYVTCYFPCWIHIALFLVCVQCPIWLSAVRPWFGALQVHCSDIL